MKGKVTIRDVAVMAQVSNQTVSRVINNRPDADKEWQRVCQVSENLNYQSDALARSLIQQRSLTLGVITAGLQFLGPPQTMCPPLPLITMCPDGHPTSNRAGPPAHRSRIRPWIGGKLTSSRQAGLGDATRKGNDPGSRCSVDTSILFGVEVGVLLFTRLRPVQERCTTGCLRVYRLQRKLDTRGCAFPGIKCSSSPGVFK
jgi:hypothetical protein